MSLLMKSPRLAMERLVAYEEAKATGNGVTSTHRRIRAQIWPAIWHASTCCIVRGRHWTLQLAAEDTYSLPKTLGDFPDRPRVGPWWHGDGF